MNKTIEESKELQMLHNGYQSFYTAWRTIRGIEIMRMIYKGQVEGVNSKDVLGEKNFIDSLLGIAV